MLSWLTVVVLVVAAVLALDAGYYAWRDKVIDDRLLLVFAVLEVALIAQAIAVLAGVGEVGGGGAEQATFAAYGLTLPFIPPAVALLAIKEKTRWSMGVIMAGAFAVAVMSGRVQQIWALHG